MSHFSMAGGVTAFLQCHLFRVVLDMVALKLDELVEAEPAQCLSFAGILPADPREILELLAGEQSMGVMEPTGAG